MLPNLYQTSGLSVVIGSLNCSGQESYVNECVESACTTSRDASLLCQGLNHASTICKILLHVHLIIYIVSMHAC